VEGAGLGTWQWNIETGRIQCNTRMLEMIGVEAFEVDVTSDFWVDRIHPDDREQWFASSRAHLANPALAHRMSLRMRHSNGRWVWLMAAGKVVDRSETGRAVHMAGVVMDVHAQKLMEQQLRTAARTDSLTQLPNRTVMLDAIGGAINRRREQPGYHFAVLFLDFDRFKQVNDTLGHMVGDQLLVEVAVRLKRSLCEDDLVVRLGGDEFVILQDSTSRRRAELLAQRLIGAMSEPFVIEGMIVDVGLSVGIALAPGDGTTSDSLLRHAHQALYRSKSRGGGYCFYDAAIESNGRSAMVGGDGIEPPTCPV
jgi:diguanylate cyclase (GGDEF)-like protein